MSITKPGIINLTRKQDDCSGSNQYSNDTLEGTLNADTLSGDTNGNFTKKDMGGNNKIFGSLRFMKRTILTCSLALLASTSLMAAASTDAHEEEVSKEAADSRVLSTEMMMARANCDIYIGTLTRSGNTLTGRGSQANCPPRSTSYLTMQRSRWYGWENLKTVKIVGPGENYVNYNCAGTGKHEFRVIHTARTIEGKPRFKESARHTWSCGN